MDYYTIVEGYKEALTDWTDGSAGRSNRDVDYNINRFKILVNKNQIKGEERNIDYWRKKPYGYYHFVTLINKIEEQPTRTQLKRKLVPGVSVNLIDTKEWNIVVPLDTNASNFYGKGTKWCTTVVNNNHFLSYFSNGNTLIYCINKPTNQKWVVVVHTITNRKDFLNSEDENITQDQFTDQTGLDVQMILSKLDAVSSTIETHRLQQQY